MSYREWVYALLGLTGLAATWYFNLRFVAQGGSLIDIGSAARLAFSNPVSSSLSIDLILAFVAFAVWAVVEARRVGMRTGWLYPLLGLFIGFAFALPLFLFFRERHLRIKESER